MAREKGHPPSKPRGNLLEISEGRALGYIAQRTHTAPTVPPLCPFLFAGRLFWTILRRQEGLPQSKPAARPLQRDAGSRPAFRRRPGTIETEPICLRLRGRPSCLPETADERTLPRQPRERHSRGLVTSCCFLPQCLGLSPQPWLVRDLTKETLFIPFQWRLSSWSADTPRVGSSSCSATSLSPGKIS